MDIRDDVQQLRDIAEADRTAPDPERDPGSTPDTVNEWGRIEASGKVEAYDAVLALLDA